MDDFLVMQGGAVKSLSDSGKFGGFLILFDVVDLENERFTKRTITWLEDGDRRPLIYAHGQSKEFGKRKITHVTVENQADGVWVEGRLPIAESLKVEQLWEGIKADKLGLSSGSSSHLVEKRRVGNVVELSTWPVFEASLTFNPAQTRSRAMALKSLSPADFDLFADHRPGPEARAREIYVQTVIDRYEQVMRDFERSQHADAKAEEFDYYNALAQVANLECDIRRIKLEQMKT
ncbi:MAG: HK97 family phage prohead protease [Pyrinomonadaceae bacterium]|nr:HK97 family phage prohead protease [Pyrinomonadaceae bacterium]